MGNRSGSHVSIPYMVFHAATITRRIDARQQPCPECWLAFLPFRPARVYCEADASDRPAFSGKRSVSSRRFADGAPKVLPTSVLRSPRVKHHPQATTTAPSSSYSVERNGSVAFIILRSRELPQVIGAVSLRRHTKSLTAKTLSTSHNQCCAMLRHWEVAAVLCRPFSRLY